MTHERNTEAFTCVTIRQNEAFCVIFTLVFSTSLSVHSDAAHPGLHPQIDTSPLLEKCFKKIWKTLEQTHANISPIMTLSGPQPPFDCCCHYRGVQYVCIWKEARTQRPHKCIQPKIHVNSSKSRRLFKRMGSERIMTRDWPLQLLQQI